MINTQESLCAIAASEFIVMTSLGERDGSITASLHALQTGESRHHRLGPLFAAQAHHCIFSCQNIRPK